MKTTDRLREHMTAIADLRQEHNRQRNCPSRGYNEDEALDEMYRLGAVIEAEMDRIDETADTKKDLGL